MVIPEADNYHTWGNGRMIVLAYTTIITIGGLLGNSLVIFLFLYFKTLRTVTNNFIVNLAACNFVLALLDLTFSLPSLFASDWIFGDVLAILYAFSYFLLVSVSMVMLAVIAIDRYHVISRPKLRARISGPKSLLVILVVYIYTLAIASPILYAPTGFEVKMFISGCYVDFTPTSNFGSGSYAIVILSLLYVVPLVTMVYYYCKIFKVLRKRRKGLTNGRGKLVNGHASTPQSLKDNTRVRIREDNTRVRPASTYTLRNTPVKTLRVIATLVILFILTWTPFQIVTIGRAFNQKEIFTDKTKETIILLTKSVVILNPVAYALVNHRFQKCVGKLFCGTQAIIGATTCTENSIDFHFSRNGRCSSQESRRNSRGSTQESRRSRYPSRVSRLSSTPEVFTSESFTPARQSTLRHSYSDSQLEKHVCIEECAEGTGDERRSRRNTDHDRFLKLGVQESLRKENWEIYVTSF
jgi:r-opsin